MIFLNKNILYFGFWSFINMAAVDVDRQRLLVSLREDSDETLLDADELLGSPGSSMNEAALQGDITVPGAPHEEEDNDYNTLDEPVKETVLRDLRAVGKKFLHVLYPKESKALLREWDLWGPLVLCVFIAMMLQGSTKAADDLNSGGPQFAEVFVLYWVGAVVVTMNIKLLGGNISFFQSVCVLGYCVLPLAIVLIICRLILIADQNTGLFALRCILVLIAFGWCTFASTAFLAESQPPKRKILAIYPIFLFYFILSWMVVSHTGH